MASMVSFVMIMCSLVLGFVIAVISKELCARRKYKYPITVKMILKFLAVVAIEILLLIGIFQWEVTAYGA